MRDKVCKKCFPKGLDYAIKQGRRVSSLICCCKLIRKVNRVINKRISEALWNKSPKPMSILSRKSDVKVYCRLKGGTMDDLMLKLVLTFMSGIGFAALICLIIDIWTQ